MDTIFSDQEYDFLFKILILGDSGVGKSSLLLRFTDNVFYDNYYMSTIGVDFKIKTMTVKNKNIKLQLWDSAGQERFRSITRSYYTGTHGIVIVFDITSKQSFDNLPAWLNDIEQYSRGSDKSCRLLIGNKTDLSENFRQVLFDEANKFAIKHNMIYIETSAKDNTNINQVFESMVSTLLEYRLIYSGQDKAITDKSALTLSQTNNINKIQFTSLTSPCCN